MKSSLNVLPFRNWLCIARAARRFLFTHQVAAVLCMNDDMAAILKLWRQMEKSTTSDCHSMREEVEEHSLTTKFHLNPIW